MMGNVALTVILTVMLYVTLWMIIGEVEDGTRRDRKKGCWMIVVVVAATVSCIWYLWI